MKNLKPQRKNIDSIDRRIIKLLSKRIKIAEKLKKIKKHRKTTDRAREREVIEHAKTMAKHHDLDPKFTEDIFKKIIKYMKEKQG